MALYIYEYYCSLGKIKGKKNGKDKGTTGISEVPTGQAPYTQASYAG